MSVEDIASLEITIQTDAVKAARDRLKELAVQAEFTEGSTKKLSKSFADLKSVDAGWSNKAFASLEKVPSLADASAKAMELLGGKIKKVHEATGAGESRISKWSEEFTHAAVASVAAYTSFEALKGGIEKVVEASVEYENVIARLSGVVGGADNAKRAFKELEEVADKTIYTEEQMAASFMELANAGLPTSAHALGSFANIASATGKSFGEVTDAVVSASMGITRAFRTFRVRAKEDGDDLKVTFRGTTETIKNDAEAIQNYLIKIGDTAYAGAAERQLNTLGGAVKELKDEWEKLLREVGQNSFGDVLKKSMKGAAEDIGNVRQAFHNLAPAIGDAASALKNYNILYWQYLYARGAIKAIAGIGKGHEDQGPVDNPEERKMLERNAAEEKEGRRQEAIDAIRKKYQLDGIKKQAEYWRDIKKIDELAGDDEQLRQELRAAMSAKLQDETNAKALTKEQEYARLLKIQQKEAWWGRFNDAASGTSRKGPAEIEKQAQEETAAYMSGVERAQRVADLRTTPRQKLLAEYNQDVADVKAYGPDSTDAQKKILDARRDKYDRELRDLKEGEADKREALRDGLRTEEEEIALSHDRRKRALDDALADQLISEREHAGALAALDRDTARKRIDLTEKYATESLGSAGAFFGEMSNVVKNFGGEQNSTFKTLFAASKAFSAAQIGVSIATGMARAQELPFPASLVEELRVAALLPKLLAQVTSSNYAGAFDAGGNIPGGQWGIVGERGPEVVRGPAVVTGRQDTARMMGGPINIRIVNAPDHAAAANFLQSAEGERLVMNIARRNSTEIRRF